MHASDAEPQTDDSILIRLEVQQAATSAVSPEVITEKVRQLLSARRLQYKDSIIPFTAEDDQTLADNLVAICIVDTETDQEAPQGTHLLFWQVWTNQRNSILCIVQSFRRTQCLGAPTDSWTTEANGLCMQVHLEIHVFQLSEEGAADDDEPEDSVSTYRDWLLPAQEFHNLWDSLVYEDDTKSRLLQYASTVGFPTPCMHPHD